MAFSSIWRSELLIVNELKRRFLFFNLGDISENCSWESFKRQIDSVIKIFFQLNILIENILLLFILWSYRYLTNILLLTIKNKEFFLYIRLWNIFSLQPKFSISYLFPWKSFTKIYQKTVKAATIAHFYNWISSNKMQFVHGFTDQILDSKLIFPATL